MSVIKKLASQTAVYGLPSIVGRLLNYFLFPLYTAYFTNPADYGVVSELYAYVAFFVVLLTFGMETTYFRFLQEKSEPKFTFKHSFFSVALINVVFLLLLFIFHGKIASAMLYSDHPEYIILLGIIVVIDAISALPLAQLRAEQKAKKFAIIQFSSILTNIILNLIFFLFFFDSNNPEFGVLFILIANLISSLVKPLLLYKSFIGLNFKVEFDLIKKMWRYAWPLVIAGFAGIINETLDRILLKQILYSDTGSLVFAEAQVGIYSACYKLAMLVTIFLQAYRYAAEPFFFSQMNMPDRNKMYSKVMNYFIAVVCLLFLLVSLNLDILKHLIRSEVYLTGIDIVPILLLANVFLGVYINQSIWYKLSGQTKYGAYIAVGGAILTIAINFTFIPVYGFRACAWATLIVYALQMTASYLLGQRHYPIKYNLRKFFLYLSTALVIFAICFWVNGESGVFNFFFNNILILLFVGLVYYIEKPRKVVKNL